ncbi:unnamed protein product [Soboliphyme baturini]|uniref:Zinc transporter 1 n=1 Tax=Soboliphyme baturini TaxID=241478 RepID=A0A183IB84_9BILA|nr:unnamed protein product [Soboliphyme baturini]
MRSCATKTCRLSVMLVLTFGYFLVEIVFGYLTNSTALVADSFHMLSDVLALLIAFFCMRFSKKTSSNKNTFGWIRAEVLGALINAVFLLALCFSIFVEALKRLLEPEEIEHPLKILIVGVVGFAVNLIGIFMFHGHATTHGHSHGRKANFVITNDGETHYTETSEKLSIISEAHNISVMNTSNMNDDYKLQKEPKDNVLDSKLLSSADKVPQLNMHGVFLHILGDALGSIIVIANAAVCWQIDSVVLRKYLDPSLSLCLAIIITCTTIPLFKESALILLQTVPTHINVQKIKSKLLTSVDGVLAVHEFHIWRLAGNKIIATAHLRCRNLEDYMKIAGQVKQFFHNEGIHSTTIQPEFLGVGFLLILIDFKTKIFKSLP